MRRFYSSILNFDKILSKRNCIFLVGKSSIISEWFIHLNAWNGTKVRFHQNSHKLSNLSHRRNLWDTLFILLQLSQERSLFCSFSVVSSRTVTFRSSSYRWFIEQLTVRLPENDLFQKNDQPSDYILKIRR